MTVEKILAANKSGLNQDYDIYWRTPVLNRAQDLGFKGIDLSTAPLVSGWRYGRAPESYISRNYRDDRAEYGLSLAALDGQEPCPSAELFFSDREVYHYNGLLVGTGSDDEPVIICLDADDFDD